MFKRQRKIQRNRLQDLYHSLRYRLLYNRLPESVYFYTFHKCASSFFGRYVLNNANGLEKVGYAGRIYSGQWDLDKALIFRDRGFIYGPIRLSADPEDRVGQHLIKPTSGASFVRDKTAIFFVRDPRDIMISAYYSFGFTHLYSPVEETKQRQVVKREQIQQMTLDEYVLTEADRQVVLFQQLYDLSVACKRSAIFKYEDMIDKFDVFAEQLCQIVSIDDAVVQTIYRDTRPRQIENTADHRRSGRVQDYKHKLEPATIQAVNKKLAGILTLFDYEL
ncbi:MAG: sulfotransferase domain-containing protein [Candidatus Promineifilaceae bacterium]